MAIRKPLSYASVMTPYTCTVLIVSTWVSRVPSISYLQLYAHIWGHMTRLTPTFELKTFRNMIAQTHLFQVIQLLKFGVELYLDMNTTILNEHYDSTLKRCEFSSPLYILLLHVMYYLLPCFLVCLLYIGIFREIWLNAKRRQNLKRSASPGDRNTFKTKIKTIVTLSLITVGFFVAWFPYFYSLAESVLFNIKRPGFKVTIVFFYFNLLWDSVVYAIRTPLIYRMLISCLVRKRYLSTSSGRTN